MIKPRTPAGTLELLPADQIAFQRMADVVRHAFEQFGFLPIETPTFELTDILLTKSGGETEKQVYFVESTGALEKSRAAGATGLPEQALRFDLTVPLARYVAEHERELAFPFRRYQMQRVFRGERQQRGRFREFLQCDVDIIGKDTLDVRYDAEPVAVICAIYSELAFGPFTVHLNNRRLLRGYFASLGIDDGGQQALLLREVDKLEKVGAERLRATLAERFGLADAQLDDLFALVGRGPLRGAAAIAALGELRGRNDELDAGVAELGTVLGMLGYLGVAEEHVAVDFAMARGLDYYTGTVYETFLDDYRDVGSIASGGRYDDLAGHYTKSRLPGVGISIGLTRLFWQLREAGLIERADSTVAVLVTLMEPELQAEALRLAAELRAAGVACESVLEPARLAKQFKYADKAGIRFVAVVGADEARRGEVTLRDLRRQQQVTVPRAEAADALRRLAAG